jgi:hypothetical protein
MGLVEITSEMTAGELVVGIGTLALAAFTAWLAWRTSAEVTASEEQIRVSRESIEAQDRPFVVVQGNTALRHRIQFIQSLLMFGINNVGKGAALVEETELLTGEGTNLFNAPLEAVLVLAAGEERNLRMPAEKGIPNAGTSLILRVWYRSASGARYVTESQLEVIEKGSCKARGHRRIDASD